MIFLAVFFLFSFSFLFAFFPLWGIWVILLFRGRVNLLHKRGVELGFDSASPREENFRNMIFSPVFICRGDYVHQIVSGRKRGDGLIGKFVALREGKQKNLLLWLHDEFWCLSLQALSFAGFFVLFVVFSTFFTFFAFPAFILGAIEVLID